MPETGCLSQGLPTGEAPTVRVCPAGYAPRRQKHLRPAMHRRFRYTLRYASIRHMRYLLHPGISETPSPATAPPRPASSRAGRPNHRERGQSARPNPHRARSSAPAHAPPQTRLQPRHVLSPGRSKDCQGHPRKHRAAKRTSDEPEVRTSRIFDAHWLASGGRCLRPTFGVGIRAGKHYH